MDEGGPPWGATKSELHDLFGLYWKLVSEEMPKDSISKRLDRETFNDMGKEVKLIPRISQNDFDYNILTEHKGKSVVLFLLIGVLIVFLSLIIGQSILKFPMFS